MAQQLIPTCNEKGLWGAVDSTGKEVVPFRYTLLANYQESLLIAALGGNPETFENSKWGLIRNDGSVLLPVVYDEVGDFDQSGYAVVRQGGKYGIINRECHFVIPCAFSAVGRFNEQGYVWVNTGGKCDLEDEGMVSGGYYGIYDCQGKEIIPVKYKTVGTFVRKKSRLAHPFTAVSSVPEEYRRIERETGLFDLYEYKYIDAKLFTQINMSFDSLIVVSTTGEYRMDGIYTNLGEPVLPEGVCELVFHPSEGIVPVGRFRDGFLECNYFKVQSQRLMFSNWPKVDCLTPFKFGKAIVAVHGANRFINTSGTKLGKPYQYIFPSETGVYVVVSENKFGIMDNEGNEIVPPSYSSIYPMREGKMLAKKSKEDYICYLSPTGEQVIKTHFKNGTSFHNGMALVQDVKGWGLIDSKGVQIMPCRWFFIKTPSDTASHLIWVKKEKGGDFYCVDARKDDYAFYDSYPVVRNFSQDYPNVAFVCNKSQKIGCINAKGEYIFPCIMDEISVAKSMYLSMLRDGKRIWTDADSYHWEKRRKAANSAFSIDSVIPESDWDY